MGYALGPDPTPELVLRIDARHAEPMRASLAVGQRMIEITHGGRAALGILCRGRDRSFGRMPVPGSPEGPAVEAAEPLEEYGRGLTLVAQQVVVTEFRRLMGGGLRGAMAALSAAFSDRPVYVAYYEAGVLAVVPDAEGWRLAAIRIDGARSMADERACAIVNRASLAAHRMMWAALDESRRAEERRAADRRRVEEESDHPSGGDLLDPDVPWPSMDDEEDAIDGHLVPDAVRDAPDPTLHDWDGPPPRFDDEDTVDF